MRIVGQLLGSRAVFISLYCIFLWFLASTVVSILSSSLRLSVPNFVGSTAPPLIVALTFLSYWFYMTKLRDGASHFSLRLSGFSIKLLLPLIITSGAGAILAVLASNVFNNAAGIMMLMIYSVGMIAILFLAWTKPHLVIPVFLLTMPFALLLHLEFRFMGLSDVFGYVVVNPEICLVLITFLALLVRVWLREIRLVRNASDIPMALFLIGSLLSLVYSPDIVFSSKLILTGVVVPIVCYYTIANGLKTKREVLLVVAVLLFSFFIMGSYSLLDFSREVSRETALSGADQLVSFFINPAFFAFMLTMILPLALMLAVSRALPLHFRLSAAGIFLILLSALVFTYIRGAWLGFAVSAVVLLLVSGDTRRVFLRSLPVLLLLIFVGWSVFSQIFWARNDSMGDFFQSLSWTERVVLWKSAWYMILDNPITGVGIGFFGASFPEYEAGYLAPRPAIGMSAHSLFLTIWAENGILTVLGMVGLMARAMYRSYRVSRVADDPVVRVIALGLFAGLIGYFVNASLHGQMLTKISADQQSYFSGFTFYLFIVLGLITALTRIHDEGEQ